MIGYVKGILTEITENLVIVECAGVGYEVMVPTSTYNSLPSLGSEVKLYTYQNVREDTLELFGFISRDDLSVYKMLITVGGIGPKGGLSILSAMTANDLRVAVLSQDAKAIARANGIGSKTAQRVIIDLKDKFNMEDVIGVHDDQPILPSSNSSAKDEAVEALTALGYSPSESMRAIAGVTVTEDMDSEAILKAALKTLAFM